MTHSARTSQRAASDRPGAPTGCVLVVDDEPGMRNFLAKGLASCCALVETAADAETAEALRARYHFDLILVDIRLPGRSGMAWIEDLRAREVRTDVVVMTAYAKLETAIAALRAGAADFLLKPFRLEQAVATVTRCLERRRIARENFLLRRERGGEGIEGLIGASAAIREVAEVVRRVAPTASTVLIEGETGTGKELVARALHTLSGRRGPFVAVNCGSIPPELLESELFGHTRGAFTSAHASREGLFSYAHGGTLFLDEISEMPAAMQPKLLRALEQKVIRPVGADRETPVDTRVVAATNRRLAEEVAAGRFREDLYFRLNVLSITVPPLRERREDVGALAEHFVTRLAEELGTAPLPLARADIAALAAYDWPGNVRELRNVIERALLLGRLPGELIRRPAPPAGESPRIPSDWTLADLERHHMLQVLERCAGNKSRAARSLGVSRKTLERRLRRWQGEGGGSGR